MEPDRTEQPATPQARLEQARVRYERLRRSATSDLFVPALPPCSPSVASFEASSTFRTGLERIAQELDGLNHALDSHGVSGITHRSPAEERSCATCPTEPSPLPHVEARCVGAVGSTP